MTLMTCVVPPGCCNREAKLHGAVARHRSRVPVVVVKRRRKSSPGILHALTSEAIYGFGRPSTPARSYGSHTPCPGLLLARSTKREVARQSHRWCQPPLQEVRAQLAGL